LWAREVVALLLAVSAWRRRRIWTARLSWPLLGWLALCLIGLLALVLISQPPSSLARDGLGQVASIRKDFDARHGLFYAGFAVATALAWRDRVSLPVLGAVLMAYGVVLEVVQEFVPTRTFLLGGPRLRWRGHSAGIVLGTFVRCPLRPEPDRSLESGHGAPLARAWRPCGYAVPTMNRARSEAWRSIG
jgi:hypothetical protein